MVHRWVAYTLLTSLLTYLPTYRLNSKYSTCPFPPSLNDSIGVIDGVERSINLTAKETQKFDTEVGLEILINDCEHVV